MLHVACACTHVLDMYGCTSMHVHVHVHARYAYTAHVRTRSIGVTVRATRHRTDTIETRGTEAARLAHNLRGDNCSHAAQIACDCLREATSLFPVSSPETTSLSGCSGGGSGGGGWRGGGGGGGGGGRRGGLGG